MVRVAVKEHAHRTRRKKNELFSAQTRKLISESTYVWIVCAFSVVSELCTAM